jgi:hypothetical protein
VISDRKGVRVSRSARRSASPERMKSTLWVADYDDLASSVKQLAKRVSSPIAI